MNKKVEAVNFVTPVRKDPFVAASLSSIDNGIKSAQNFNFVDPQDSLELLEVIPYKLRWKYSIKSSLSPRMTQLLIMQVFYMIRKTN